MTMPPREISDQALAWLTRLNSGTPSSADRHAAAAWRAAAPAHEAAFREAETLWSLAAGLEETPGGMARPAPARHRHRWPALAALAASLLLVAAATLWQAGALADFTTRAAIRQVALEDGSDLRLDARSAADLDFTATARRLNLRHGALFVQVARAPNRPFTVMAGDVGITALGTAFEVAHEQGGAVRVAVAEHAVAVTGPGNLELIVRQGETVRVARDGKTSSVQSVAPNSVAAWRTNRLVAEGEALSAVAASLSAHSNGWILVPDEHLARMKVNAVLDLDDTEGSLRALQSALPLEIRHIGGVVTVLTARK